MRTLSRREFTRLLAATAAAGGGLSGCSRSSSYTDEDTRRLATQMKDEEEHSGRGPFGPLRYLGYRGLTELPYLVLDPDGELRVAVKDLPPVIDFHAHLGWSMLFAPTVNLRHHAPRTKYLLDCDNADPPCFVDLDVYVNANFTEPLHAELSHEIRDSLLFGSEAARTHTIPNLVAEMDRMGVSQAVILPVDTGLPFSEDATLHILDGIEQAGARSRLIPFASVHPRDSRAREKLRAYARRGALGVKLHPEMQRFFPDDSSAMEIYEECGRLGLPVMFHAGRSGIEPAFMRKYALMRRFLLAVKTFPEVRFVMGHAGARDVAEAIPMAKKHSNVWLEISGQGVTQLYEIMNAVGTERLLFGNDWPFYPIAVTLAKALIVTERQPKARAAILHENAERLLGPPA